MKLQALRALVAAVDEGSIRAAARRMDLSQPAVTKMIRLLEAELAAPLLARTRAGVVPTAQGRMLVSRAAPLLHELAAVADEIGQMDGRMTGDLHVSAVPVAVLCLMPETVRTYSREFPGMRLRVSEELYVAQLHALRQQEADVVVGPVPADLPSGEFHVEPLMSVDMLVVARRDSPWARASRLADLAGARWVYTSAGGRTGYARQLFEQHGLPAPPAAAVVNSTLGLLSLLSGEDFVGLLPRPMMQHPMTGPELRALSLAEGSLRLPIGAMTRTVTASRPAVRQFLRHLQRAARLSPPGAPAPPPAPAPASPAGSGWPGAAH